MAYTGSGRGSNLTPGKTSKSVSRSYNKSGIALTGPGGSGSFSYSDVESKNGKVRIRPGSAAARVVQPGGSGNLVKPGTTRVGSGDETRYIDVPEAAKDAGKTTKPLAVTLTAKANERPAPTNRGTTPKADESTGGAASSKKASTSSKGLTLNDFMELAKTSGKSNAYRRGYQMWKNYQRTGKVPQRRIQPD